MSSNCFFVLQWQLRPFPTGNCYVYSFDIKIINSVKTAQWFNQCKGCLCYSDNDFIVSKYYPGENFKGIKIFFVF